MHVAPLYLSHWDASVPISIPAEVVEVLKEYHVMGVRFLYDCYRKTQKGAILNHESGMNYPIQVSAFFNALQTFITPQSPVLVVCSVESLKAWLYHLTTHGGFFVTSLSSKSCEEIVKGEVHRVILATAEDAKLLREIKESDFFAVVVEELDKVAAKMIVKQLKGQFNIGLTNRNFLKHPDQKLFWSMLKWSNPTVVGKLDEFCEEDTAHLMNLRYPYGAWWQRLTWKFSDTFKVPSDDEQKQYKKEVQQWCATNRTLSNIPKVEVKRQTRKRKAEEKTIKNEIKEEPLSFHSEVSDISDHTKNIPKTSKSNKTRIQNKEASPKKQNNLLQNSTVTLTPNQNCSQYSDGSDDTIIYDFKDSPSSDVDDNPILFSILSSFDNSESARMSGNESEGDIKQEQHSLSKQEVLPNLSNSQTQSIENSSLAKTLDNSNTQNSNSSSASRRNEMLSLLYGESD